jgi:hypothetical protein
VNHRSAAQAVERRKYSGKRWLWRRPKVWRGRFLKATMPKTKVVLWTVVGGEGRRLW